MTSPSGPPSAAEADGRRRRPRAAGAEATPTTTAATAPANVYGWPSGSESPASSCSSPPSRAPWSCGASATTGARSTCPPYSTWSTAILLFSSVALEIARRQLRNGTLDKLRTWTFATLVLGLAFLVAQTLGWRDLLAQGVSMSNSASGSFFYILTAAHALHVLGGIGALIYLAARARMARPWANRLAAVDATAIYWHFLGVLWVYLFILLGVLA
ncbi:MAG: cytochrome c oxidase subunit 3 [Bryobacterales bacterium]